jgi:Fe2+ transport system protein FeoA
MPDMSSEYRLSELKRGQKGEILLNKSLGSVRRRLLDMGLVRGMKFEIVRKAPLGDPIEIQINGFLLSLRKEEAHDLVVKTEP